MVKRRVIIEGDVQAVGYRVLVKKIARSLGIKGVVRNLDNGAVEIYCEGNAGSMKKFLEMIDVKRRDGNLLAINVKTIRIYHEKARGYAKTKAPKRFGIFDIDYGDDLTFAEKEMIERQELMILGGSQMWNGIDVVGERVDTGFTELGEKVDTGFTELGQNVDGVGQDVRAMHGDMNERFDKLDEKYALIGESLIETNKNLGRMNENIKNLVETTSENNAQMNEVLRSQTDALTKLINVFVEKESKEDQ